MGGGGATVPSLITTQMVQGPVFFLTGVRAHVGGVAVGGAGLRAGCWRSLQWEFCLV